MFNHVCVRVFNSIKKMFFDQSVQFRVCKKEHKTKGFCSKTLLCVALRCVCGLEKVTKDELVRGICTR